MVWLLNFRYSFDPDALCVNGKEYVGGKDKSVSCQVVSIDGGGLVVSPLSILIVVETVTLEFSF